MRWSFYYYYDFYHNKTYNGSVDNTFPISVEQDAIHLMPVYATVIYQNYITSNAECLWDQETSKDRHRTCAKNEKTRYFTNWAGARKKIVYFILILSDQLTRCVLEAQLLSPALMSWLLKSLPIGIEGADLRHEVSVTLSQLSLNVGEM